MSNDSDPVCRTINPFSANTAAVVKSNEWFQPLPCSKNIPPSSRSYKDLLKKHNNPLEKMMCFWFAQMEGKGNLRETQQAYVKRLNSTLSRINTPFDRPSEPLHGGQPYIVVGLSLSLEKPATIAIWDAKTNQVLAQYGIRQLLGGNYRLLTRRRAEQQKTAHQCHKAQKRGDPKQLGDSELGQYVDRLLAKSIVAIAKTYEAGSIAVPKLEDLREIVEAEIRSRAEQKCPGYLKGQRKYAKQYRMSVHRWSYRRLIDSIRTQALKLGIAIEEAKQPLTGQLEEKARNVAIAAYQART